MKARTVILAGAVAALTACGSASDSVTFQAPPSFHEKASVGPFMQVWESAPHTVLVLMSLPVSMDLNKAMDQADLKDATVHKREHIAICGNQDAVFIDAEGTMNAGKEGGNGRPSEIEFIATNVKGKTYLAFYGRPLHSAADPAAEAAIRNVCPK